MFVHLLITLVVNKNHQKLHWITSSQVTSWNVCTICVTVLVTVFFFVLALLGMMNEGLKEQL